MGTLQPQCRAGCQPPLLVLLLAGSQLLEPLLLGSLALLSSLDGVMVESRERSKKEMEKNQVSRSSGSRSGFQEGEEERQMDHRRNRWKET